jgi:DNA-binding IclR family transcriptional regulator
VARPDSVRPERSSATASHPLAAEGLSGGSFSQTLDRGVRLLEILSQTAQPCSAAELSAALGIHRSVTYRLLRTLKEHQLLDVEPDGRYTLGLGLLTLARSVRRDLRATVMPYLADLSQRLRATVFLGIGDGDELVCFASAEPENTMLQVRFREGLRHPLATGAAGMAILSMDPARPGERPELTVARTRGYAVSREELERGTVAIAAPVRTRRAGLRASVAALFPAEHVNDEAAIAAQVVKTAGEMSVAVS